MAFIELTPPPTPPSRDDDPDTFIERADAFVAWQATYASQMTTLIGQLEVTAALIGAAPAYADPGLLALTGNTPAADRLPYYNASDGSELAVFTAFARSLLDDADDASARVTLGLGSAAVANTSAFDAAGTASSAVAALAATLGDVAGFDTLPIENGGTGQTTQEGAFNAIAVAASSYGSNGFIKFANGVYLMWGSFTATGNTTMSYSYDTIDPSISLTTFSIAVISGVGELSATAQDNFPAVTYCTTGGFSILNASTSAETFFIAVGK